MIFIYDISLNNHIIVDSGHVYFKISNDAEQSARCVIEELLKEDRFSQCVPDDFTVNLFEVPFDEFVYSC